MDSGQWDVSGVLLSSVTDNGGTRIYAQASMTPSKVL